MACQRYRDFSFRHVGSVTEAHQVHCPLVVIFPAVNMPDHGACHSPASGAEVCNAYGFTSVPIVVVSVHAAIVCDTEVLYELDTVGTVYHLVIYMQSSKIPKVF